MAGCSRRRFLAYAGAGAVLPSFHSRAGRLIPWHWPRPGLEAIAARLGPCSRDAAFSTAIECVRGGATWQDILGATLLVGTREVSPQPIGNHAHSIMMVESAFQLASQTTPSRRPLPVLFNLDYVKRSQHRDNGWKLPPKPDGDGAKLTLAEAQRLFDKAMRGWDEKSADRAVVNLYATTKRDELFECIWPYALRDFRFIGHKPIYAAAICRSLGRVGWKHGLPMLRSLVLGLLDGRGQNRAWTATFASNGRLARKMKVDWTAGRPDPKASMKLLGRLRSIKVNDAGPAVAELLARKVSPASIWDGLRLYAAEVLMHQRGIAGVHLTTSINALHFIWRTTKSETTKRLAILQAASWMPMFRDDFKKRRGVRMDGPGIDSLQAPVELPAARKVLEVGHGGRSTAACHILGMAGGKETAVLEESFRRLVFQKGTESHFYKYSAAMLEEFRLCHPAIAPRILAAGAFYLPVGSSKDARVYTRARTALRKLDG